MWGEGSAQEAPCPGTGRAGEGQPIWMLQEPLQRGRERSWGEGAAENGHLHARGQGRRLVSFPCQFHPETLEWGDRVHLKTEGAEQVSNLAQVTQLGNGQEAGSSGADGTLAGQDSEGSQEHSEESVAHIFKNTKRIRLFLA